jgi:tetratricopeptide (TPR) repeat protein
MNNEKELVRTLFDGFAAAYDSQRYQDALIIVTEIVRLGPSLATSWHNLGLTYEALGEKDNAVASYWQASKLHPLRRGLASAWAVMTTPRRGSSLQSFIKAVLEDDPEARPVLVALAESSGLMTDREVAELLGMGLASGGSGSER